MNAQIVINKTEKPNSFECGKAGNRFKIYFENITDLTSQLKDLSDAGLYIKEEPKI